MAKHYEIVGKKIIADISKLTPKELKEVKNYIALEYELVEKTKKDNAKKPQIEWTYEYVQEFLKKNATAKQIEEYEQKYNEVVIDKETGKEKVYEHDVYEYEETIDEDGKKHRKVKKVKGEKVIKHYKGEKVIKGHIATLKWLEETFDEYKKLAEENKKNKSKNK